MKFKSYLKQIDEASMTKGRDRALSASIQAARARVSAKDLDVRDAAKEERKARIVRALALAKRGDTGKKEKHADALRMRHHASREELTLAKFHAKMPTTKKDRAFPYPAYNKESVSFEIEVVSEAKQAPQITEKMLQDSMGWNDIQILRSGWCADSKCDKAWYAVVFTANKRVWWGEMSAIDKHPTSTDMGPKSMYKKALAKFDAPGEWKDTIGMKYKPLTDSVEVDDGESIEEASSKVKFSKVPTIGTFRSGMDTKNPTFTTAMRPLKLHKTDVAGRLIKGSPSEWMKDKRAAASDAIVSGNIKDSEKLMQIINMKPEGTKFEIYGKKNGKEYIIKVKKIRSVGEIVFFMMPGNRQVEIRSSSAGLQVLDKNTQRQIMSNGNDMIWESADLADCGRMYI